MTLVVVSGPPGAGKTTLAHTLARAIGCPAICRDELKEGMVHAGTTGDLNLRTLDVFFATLRALVDGGVSVVAEAAFQDHVWRPRLEVLRADLRVIRCEVDPAVARDRMLARPHRAAHDDGAYLAQEQGAFGWITLDVPTLRVATGDGYDPPLAAIAAFSR